MKKSQSLKDEHIEDFAGAGFRLCNLQGKIPGKGFLNVKHESPIEPEKFPNNYGVVLNADHLVIDVDPRNFPEDRNCEKELESAIGKSLKKLCGFYVKTGGGGTHYYFRKPHKALIKHTLKEYPGIEFKSKGRQVVGPGSIHPDTAQPYVLIGNPMDLFDTPVELLDLIKGHDIKLEKGLDECDDSEANKIHTRQALAEHPPAKAGERGNDTTFQAACICKDYGVSKDLALQLMEEYNERCEPPWMFDELVTFVNNAYRYGQNALGSKNIRYDFDAVEATDQENQSAPAHYLRAMSLDEFLRLEIPPRENILAPIIQTQCLAMIYAKRGVGKTYLALSLAHAIASGGKFLKWQAEKSWRVLYLDGEMPANVMQERLAMIQKSTEKTPLPGYFKIINADLNLHTAMPDLSTAEGRKMIEPFVKDFDVIVVDNISTLSRTGKENEAESWIPMQQWALDMRRKGKTVIFIHHAGKNGAQRGTSKREDILDLVVRLEQPQDYNPAEGARFEVHFDKTRNIMGEDAKSFETMIVCEQWTYREIEDVRLQKIIDLKEEGLSFKEIAEEIGMSKSTAQRLYQQHENQKKMDL